MYAWLVRIVSRIASADCFSLFCFKSLLSNAACAATRWDKDEDLVDDYGVNVHPAISTVTYLTDCGAPTLVLNHRAPMMYEDLDGFRGQVLEG
jgi:hypothetical protein